jgi:hypothetical protein
MKKLGVALGVNEVLTPRENPTLLSLANLREIVTASQESHARLCDASRGPWHGSRDGEVLVRGNIRDGHHDRIWGTIPSH